MKNNLILFALIYAGAAFGGGSTGTGTPPSRLELEEVILASETGHGALFDTGFGELGLLTNSQLHSRMTLTNNLSVRADITVPDTDFELLRNRNAPIDSLGRFGENKSYLISDGDQIETLTLVDRRVAARTSIRQ